MLRSLVLALALVVVVAACGDDDSATTAAPTTTTVATTTAPTTTGASTTAAPTTTTTAPAETTTTTAGPTVIEVAYEEGEVSGVDRRVAVQTGDQVRIEVTSDVADHVHLHGYDVFADVGPGMQGVIEFTADIPGIFEVELEESHDLLFELEVS